MKKMAKSRDFLISNHFELIFIVSTACNSPLFPRPQLFNVLVQICDVLIQSRGAPVSVEKPKHIWSLAAYKVGPGCSYKWS